MFPTMKNDVNTYLWAIANNLWNALKREILFYCPAFWHLWCFGGLRQHHSLHSRGVKGLNRCAGIVKEGESWQKDRWRDKKGEREWYSKDRERLEKDREMKQHNASLLPYLVIFIPLCSRFIHTSDRHQIHHSFLCFVLWPIHTTDKHQTTLVVKYFVVTCTWFIMSLGAPNRKSIHVINSYPSVLSHLSLC